MFILPEIIETSGRNKKSFSIPTKLFEQDIITLFDEIDDDIAYAIISQLLYLDSIDTNDHVKLYINSPGGLVTSGLAIMDTIQAMRRKVDTIGIGQCASMGAILLITGTGTRKSLKNTSIMLHSISSGTAGTIHDQLVTLKEVERKQELMMKIIEESSNMSLDDAIKYTKRDMYLNPTEAIKFGLIDEII